MYYSVIDTTNGPIYFAGEHTARPHGWINSAIYSGVRAAKRLLVDFCGQSGRYGGGYRSGNLTESNFKHMHWTP